MASVDENALSSKDFSEMPHREPQSSQPLQSHSPPRQQTPPRSQDAPASPSSSRMPHLLESPLEGSDGQRYRQGTLSRNNSANLVNHPAAQSHDASSFAGPDRPFSVMHDPTQVENVPQVQPGDRVGLDRRTSRASAIPRPRPIFPAPVSGVGNGNETLRGSQFDPGAGGLDVHTDVLVQERPKTIKERIQPTLDAAIKARDKYKAKAQRSTFLLNGAIGLQVVVGAITTGVAAGGSNVGTAVAALGGTSTVLATYLAKMRGSGEPESSKYKGRELETFVRQVDAFVMDKGHITGSQFDHQIDMYREQFELIIKTEDEGSMSGTRFAGRLRNHAAPGPISEKPYSGPNQNFTSSGGYGQLSGEKQHMWSREKYMGEMA